MDDKAYKSVINYTKFEILSGRLRQGQKLPPERELAAKIGVCRTSVREALRVMEILGLIESVQGSGNFITETLSMMFLLQQAGGQKLNEVRTCLELKAAELAIDNITDEGMKNLNELMQKMNSAINEEAEASFDKQLHLEIAAASNNPILIQMLNAMSALTDGFIRDIRKSILSDNKNRVRLKKIHFDIITAIKNRNKEAVCNALTHHSEIIDEYLEDIL